MYHMLDDWTDDIKYSNHQPCLVFLFFFITNQIQIHKIWELCWKPSLFFFQTEHFERATKMLAENGKQNQEKS